MIKRLEAPLFQTIVANTPLISVDLIVINKEGLALLGQRRNRPAQNYWFVPGGRVFKDESFEQAFRRITNDELGMELTLNTATFRGVYEHFYEDNFSGDNFSTHYVVHGYTLSIDAEALVLPRTQHTDYKWFNVEALSNEPFVHQYTKNYFLSR